jgi:hypothetical protein
VRALNVGWSPETSGSGRQRGDFYCNLPPVSPSWILAAAESISAVGPVRRAIAGPLVYEYHRRQALKCLGLPSVRQPDIPHSAATLWLAVHSKYRNSLRRCKSFSGPSSNGRTADFGSVPPLFRRWTPENSRTHKRKQQNGFPSGNPFLYGRERTPKDARLPRGQAQRRDRFAPHSAAISLSDPVEPLPVGCYAAAKSGAVEIDA